MYARSFIDSMIANPFIASLIVLVLLGIIAFRVPANSKRPGGGYGAVSPFGSEMKDNYKNA